MAGVVAVVTAPARPAGRRAEPSPTPVADRAAVLGLPVLTPTRLRDPETQVELAGLRARVGILADYGRILPQAVLDLFERGILNLHPSLLPRHRGAAPIPAAIAAGDTETGVTLFRMDAGMDTGPIVAVERAQLAGDEDAPGLEDRLASVAARLLASALPGWLTGSIEATPQPTDGVTVTRPLRREDGRLDPAVPAAVLERLVRAYRPWPGTFVAVGDERLAVLDAQPAPSEPGDVPGTLVRDGSGLALATAEGRLRLRSVQPAGGRAMDGAAYLRGRPRAAGVRVG